MARLLHDDNGGFPFGNASLNWATGCPCTGITAAGTSETTTCGDGNFTIKWSGLAAGTYYYPVRLDAANHAAGNYTLHVVCMPSYCASNATSTGDETLKTVQLGTIDNTTLDCDKYNDFTYLSTDVIAGWTYPFNIVIGDCEGASCYTKRLAIFIDLNQDYDFLDAGEWVYNSGQLTSTPCPDFPIERQHHHPGNRDAWLHADARGGASRPAAPIRGRAARTPGVPPRITRCASCPRRRKGPAAS